MHDTIEGINLYNLDIEVPPKTDCYIETSGNNVKCYKKIFGINMHYHHNAFTNLPMYCVAGSRDKTDIANQICKSETGEENGACRSTYCTYTY